MAELFLLDANVFIQAARMYYAFDLVPTFWEALIGQASEGRMRSIDRVKQELLKGNDDLADWAKNQFRESFHSTAEPDVIEAYREIMVWAQGQEQYFAAAKAEFASVADGWLVAYARAKHFTVVTHEQFKPDARKRILIPNVCRAFSVPTTDTFSMLRRLGVRL